MQEDVCLNKGCKTFRVNMLKLDIYANDAAMLKTVLEQYLWNQLSKQKTE